MKYCVILPVGRDPQPVKLANMELLAMGAVVAMVASRLGMSIPQVERMRLESPTMYAALLGMVSLLGANELTRQPEQQQQGPVPGALLPPGFMV